MKKCFFPCDEIFRICPTAVLTLVLLLYIPAPGLIYQITGNLYLLAAFSQFSHPASRILVKGVESLAAPQNLMWLMGGKAWESVFSKICPGNSDGHWSLRTSDLEDRMEKLNGSWDWNELLSLLTLAWQFQSSPRGLLLQIYHHLLGAWLAMYERGWETQPSSL